MKEIKNLLAVSALMIAGDVGPYTTYTSRKGKLVFFNRAPPKEPASPAQLHMRGMWRLVAEDWQMYTTSQRRVWESISKKTCIVMTGYNLFMACETTPRGRGYLPTLLRQAGIPAAPPFRIHDQPR